MKSAGYRVFTDVIFCPSNLNQCPKDANSTWPLTRKDRRGHGVFSVLIMAEIWRIEIPLFSLPSH